MRRDFCLTDVSSCIHCGANRFEKLLAVPIHGGSDRMYLLRCPRCGLARNWLDSTPAPTARPAASAVRVRPVLRHIRSFLASISDRSHLKAIEMHRGVGTLLDVGCGNGRLLALARSREWAVIGCDPDPAAVTAAMELHQIEIHHGDLSTFPKPAAPFDVVICRFVMEHFQNPAEDLKHMQELLTPGGLLLAYVPNLASLQARLFGARWFPLRLVDHVHQFTPATLAAVASKADFEIMTVDTPTTPADLVGVAASLIPTLDPDRIPQSGIHFMWFRLSLLAALAAIAFIPSAVASLLGRGGTIRLLAKKRD